jgi:hypothetical protein
MSNLNNIIDDIISKYINDYNERISNKYKIPYEDLDNIWKKLIIPSPDTDTDTDTDNTQEVTTEPDSKNDNIECETVVTRGTCCYVFSKGQNKGKSCETKLKTNNKYCSKHKKYENKVTKTKKILPKTKKISSYVNVKNTKKLNSSSEDTNIILRKNKKINKFWHSETKLVFKSDKEPIVIGKYEDDMFINDLSEEDINKCIRMNFKYEKSEIKKAIEDNNLKIKDVEDILKEIQEVDKYYD